MKISLEGQEGDEGRETIEEKETNSRLRPCSFELRETELN